MAKVVALRAAVPHIALSTDFIVGFPGETEEEFEMTLELLRQIRFDASFSFAYSPREGTPAATLPGEIPALERKRRLSVLQAVQKEITLERNQAEVGTIAEVLVEGRSRHRESELTGRTPSFKTVNFSGDKGLVGQEVRVRITSAHVNTLRGTLLAHSEEK
jgi:tRNA-2-methylthio-N6-dimethylallyladenosine synthase